MKYVCDTTRPDWSDRWLQHPFWFLFEDQSVQKFCNDEPVPHYPQMVGYKYLNTIFVTLQIDGHPNIRNLTTLSWKHCPGRETGGFMLIKYPGKNFTDTFLPTYTCCFRAGWFQRLFVQDGQTGKAEHWYRLYGVAQVLQARNQGCGGDPRGGSTGANQLLRSS